MKIKVLEDHQGLKKDQVIENMCPMTAGILIEQGKAVNLDAPVVAAAPKTPDPPVTDKAPHKCNRTELDAIVAAEKVDIGDASTNTTIADAIVVHRENILAAETVNEITTYLATRTECDETCRYADGDDCNIPDDYDCPTLNS